MNDKQRIAEDAKRFAGLYKGFLAAAEMLGQIGSIEAATAEAEQKLRSARAVHDSAMAGLADERATAEGHIKKAQDQAGEIRRAAEAEAAGIRAKAAAEHSDAQARKDAAIQAANRDAAKILEEANGRVASLGDIERGLNEKIAGLRADINALTTTRDERANEIAAIDSRIAALARTKR